MSPPTNYWR